MSRASLQRTELREKRVLIVENSNTIRELAEALSSPIRLLILRQVSEYGEINLKKISELTGLPLPIISKHVAKLEKAGLIISGVKSGRRGLVKIIRKRFDRIIIKI